MDQNTTALIARLKQNPALAKELLSSGDGQALMNSLTRRDGGRGLRRATADAAKGDTRALGAMLKELMNSPEGSALMQRLNDQARQQNR